jgi:hypothetical protein
MQMKRFSCEKRFDDILPMTKVRLGAGCNVMEIAGRALAPPCFHLVTLPSQQALTEVSNILNPTEYKSASASFSSLFSFSSSFDLHQ